MVAEGHRLGRLHVGEAGHDGVGVGFGLVEQDALQRLQLPRRPVAGVPHPEPEIQGHLVVARAGRV